MVLWAGEAIASRYFRCRAPEGSSRTPHTIARDRPAPFMTTIRTIATADWGLALRRAARIAAPLVVLLFVLAADLVTLTHAAGKATGEAIAGRSDQLAALFSKTLVPADPAPMAAQPLAPAPVTQALVLELEAMSHRQLMVLAGTRRKLAKRQLIAMVAAA